MATLDQTIDIQPTTPNPDFEPEEEWKNSLRQRIEDTLKPAAEKLKRELTEKLKDLSPPEISKAHVDYDNAMIGLRRTANEQYRQLLERERQERRWAAGEEVDEKWAEMLMKEQQALLDNYKNTMGKKDARGEGHSQPPPSLDHPPAPRMETFEQIIDIQPTTPNPDFEPEEEWKTSLRQRIEDALKPAAEKLKRELNEKLKDLSSPEDSKAQTDYDNAMAGLRRTANEEYRQLVERERQERRWIAAREGVNGEWAEILMREQQAFLKKHKNGDMGKANQLPEQLPGVVMDLGRPIQLPPLSPSSRPTRMRWTPPSNENRTLTHASGQPMESVEPRRDTNASVGITSSALPEASPVLSHPATIPGTRRPSNILPEPVPEDSPPTRLSRESRPYSSTGSRSQSNGRVWSSTRPPWEIWKPSPNESTSSRTSARGTGGMTEPRRDTSFSTTSSVPSKASPAPSHPPQPSRPPPEDWEPRPYSSAGNYQLRLRPPPRPTPEIWNPSLNESTTSRSLTHATGGMRKPRRDSSSSFPTTIPQDTSLGADMDKDNEKLWSDIIRARQKARKDSAGAGDRVTVVKPPPDLKRDDSDDDRKQRLIAEFSRQKTNAKQMEEVMEQRAETQTEAELGAKEAEAKQREEELKRKEEVAVEEARRKLKELRKEDELRSSFTNEPHQPSRPQRTPSPTTLASGSSSTTPTPDKSSNLSALADPKSSACRRLISHTFSPHETVSLIQVIFTSKAEINIIRDLRGDDAQAFIDAVHGALDLPDLLPWLRKKCLSVLCKICGRQALLPKSLRVPLCYNRSDNPLYRGGYADVWKGEHRGRHVAVKVLRVYSTGDSDKITSRFCKEVVTWKALDHPNVLPLLGVTMGNNHFAMASEWMVNGNINEYIRTNRDANRFELLKDVARGLIYVHGQAMIHGDLKGANILIDKDGLARLADFGLLTIVSDPTNYTASSSVVTRGTTRWMSPELLDPDQFESSDGRPTRESDCYALGMVIYEVLSGKVPFASLREFIVMRKVLEGERPSMPEGAEGAWFTDGLWTTLNLCWETQPEIRPSIEAVLERLSQVSGTWEPPSPRAKEDSEEDDSDWDLTTEMIL